MPWIVILQDEFKEEVFAFPDSVQDAIMAAADLIARRGPDLRMPHARQLKGSKHTNMKELRFNAAGGVWRLAFAFDSNRQAVLLAIVNKVGKKQNAVYKRLTDTADRRYDLHIA